MTRALLLTTVLFLTTGALGAQNSIWMKAGKGAIGRTGHAVAEFNGKIWSLGGRTPDAGAPSAPTGALSNAIWSTTDGANWTLESLTAPWSAREGHTALSFNGRLWIIGGQDDIWSSADGLVWKCECAGTAFGTRNWHTSVVFNNRMWVIGGSADDVWSSADGVAWRQELTVAPWGLRAGHQSVVLNGRIYLMGGTVSGGFMNDIWSSSDGITWQLDTSAASWGARDGASATLHNGRMYLLGGTINLSGDLVPVADVWSSTDGVNWSAETFWASWSARAGATMVSWNSELWVLGGNGADGVGFMDAWSSTDGSSWIEQAPYTGLPPGRLSDARCTFNGRLWLIGGATTGYTVFGDVWSSPDGINWTQMTPLAPFGERSGHAVEVLNGRMYVMGGEKHLNIKDDVWSSADGVNWTLESTDTWPVFPSYTGFGGRTNHQTAVMNGRIWVFGGLIPSATAWSPDVWSSADGANWTLEGSGYPVTSHLKVEVLNGQFWAFGGSSTMQNPGVREILSSADGVNWTQHTNSAPWGTRSMHATAVVGGRIVLVGGSVVTTHGGWQPGYKNDLWSTTDGANWAQESPVSSFQLGRASAHADVLNGRLWMYGGWDGNGAPNYYRNQDCWSLIENGTAPQFTSNPPAALIVAGNSYSYAPTATGSPAPTIVLSGSIPGWLEIDATTGAMSGTPSVADIGQTHNISLTASNAFGSDVQTFQITVFGPAPQFTSVPVTVATAGVPYAYTAAAVGGPPAPALSVGALPSWLTFDSNTGLMTGTPGAADIGLSAKITITATNGTPPDAHQSFQIDVQGTPAQIISSPVTSVVSGGTYNYAIATLGLPAATYTSSGLPQWLALDGNTGMLSGSPMLGTSGSVTVTVTADNGWGSDSQTFDIVIIEDAATGGAGGPRGAGCAAGDGATSWFALGLLGALVLLAGQRRTKQTS